MPEALTSPSRASLSNDLGERLGVIHHSTVSGYRDALIGFVRFWEAWLATVNPTWLSTVVVSPPGWSFQRGGDWT